MTKTVIRISSFVTLAFAVCAMSACEATKSRTPTSPNVAGPIAGVNITAPSAISPANGTEVLNTEPLRLVLGNASTNSERSFWYVVELAADAGFNTRLYTNPKVTPASGAQTTVVVDVKLGADATYYWRVKADDGANSSSYSSAHFDLVVPVVIDPPVPASPVNGATVANNTPELVVNNGRIQGRVGSVEYRFEVSTDQAFTNLVSLAQIPRTGGAQTVHPSAPLPGSTLYFWRVRGTNGLLWSGYSGVQSFRTPTPPPPPPPPGGGGGGGGGGGPVPDDWRKCGSTPGDALVQCVHAVVKPARTEEGAFEVTKRVAWLLRGSGGGLLIKNGGENIVSWKGYSFSAGRICFPDGHIYKVLSDIPSTNGPSWQDNGFVDRSLYVPAIDPG
jgi:hypothetical protein